MALLTMLKTAQTLCALEQMRLGIMQALIGITEDKIGTVEDKIHGSNLRITTNGTTPPSPTIGECLCDIESDILATS